MAVALGAVAQTVTGFGLALVCAPFLVAAFGPGDGVRQAVLLSSVINAAILLREGRAARVGDALLLLAPAAAATPLLALALRRLDARSLTVVAGLATIFGTVALARGLRLRRVRGVWGAAGAGVVSAAMNVIGGLSGPAVALYIVNAGWPAASVRPTLQAYSLVLNLITLGVLGMPTLIPQLFVGLIAGWAGGSLLAGHLSPTWARHATLIVAATGGVLAVLKGLR